MESMRKFKSLFFLIIAAFVLFVAIGCGGSKIELSFDNETYTVEVGKEITVAPTVKNEENEEYTLVYSSTDETIATYIDGKVKGLKVGETDIKVSLEGNDKIFATAKVVVVEVTKYTVTFDTDGGTEIASVQVVKGEKLTLPTAPTKAGYVFKGWFTNEARTVPFNPDVAINANTTLYAKWEVAQYTVTFDSNGGSAVSPVGVNHGGKVQKPTNPTKENHDFVGWFTAEDEEFDFLNTTITSDLTLYAKWELKTFEVVFNSDGGTFVPAQSIKYGAKATKPADPTKDGYIFKGWFKDVNRTQPFDFDEEVITDITILYAKWEYDMTGKAQVEFVLDEGVYFPINQLDFFLAGIEPTGSHPIASYLGVYGNEIASKGIMIYHTVVSGYLWSTKLLVARNANGFYEVVAKAAAGTSLPSDLPDYEFVILGHDSNYAAYQFVNSISVGNIITFVNWDFSTTEGGLVPQGAMLKVYPAGSGDLTTPAILEEGAALPSPMKADATFLGWYDNPEFTGEPVTGAVTGKLYAKWGAPVRTITYNLDGGVFGYADKAAMVADFMKDFNKMFNMNITADQFQAKTYQKNVFTIFSDPTYGPKWVWMREYLIKVAEETGHGSAVELKNNNDGFWRSTIDSFLNDRVRVDWPSTVDYSNPELAEGFWYVFKPVESFTRESDTFTLLTPKKEYHTFVGWYTNPEFTGSPVTQVVKGTDQDLVLYAKFEPILVDVTFMDGEELVQVVAVPMNTKVAALAALSKQGYLFTGWYADAAATTLFDFDTLILEPVTIYAGWTEALDSTVEYEAVYNEARGRWYIKVIGPIDLDINTIKDIYLITEAGVNIDPVALIPDTDKVLWFSVALEDGDLTFKKAGIYTYKAVKLDDTEVIFGYDYDPELVTGIKHKVEFDTNGGSLIDVVIVDMKTKVTKPADPTKEGMIFAGWYVDPEFKTAYNFDTPVTKNLVLYAKWHYPPFPITYHLDGGEFLPPVFDSKQEMVEAFLTDFYNFMNPTEVTLEEWMHKAEEPGKYTGKWLDNFASLYEKNNRSVDENSTKFINQPLYNAKWLPFFDMMEEFTKGVNSAQSFWNDTYVASLRMPVYMRGEKPWSFVPDSVYNLFPEAYVLVKEYKHEGPEFELPTNLVKEGYVFAGWYDNPEFTGDRYYVIPVGTFGPIHLYAKWVEEGQVDLSEIVVAAGYEDGETFTYLGRTFVMGQNAFATLQDALAVAPNNAKIYVLEGTYADAATVTQNGLTIIGNNAVITGTINVASGVNGLTIKGFTFTNKGQVLIDVKGGVSNFTFEGNHVYDTTTVVISFKNDGTDVNTNFVIKNNVFEVVNLTAFDGRYIRGGNITNLTITGNKFVGLRANYVDAIRIEGKNESNSEGTGAAGVVLIEGNEFINIGQRAIWFRVYSATSITIQDNLFDWAGDQSYGGAIQLETWKAGQTTEITIKQNTFKNIMASFYVRLNNSGMAANATWKVDINYNEFFAPITTATSLYVDAYSEAAANLINAENNIFHEEPVPSRFKFVGKYSELVSEDDVFYTVEFNTDGGSEISPVVVKEGRKVQKPADPTKPGSEFVGWFADDERTIPFDFSTPITKNTVIFAKWEEILPTIADVRAANVNDLVVTKGIVTLKIGNNAYIQDATGGIYVYVGTGSGSAELGSKLVVGNEVKVVGKRAVFNQAAQIGTIQSIEVLNTNQTVPAAVEVTDLSKLLEYEGQLVTIKDVTITYIPNIGTGAYSVKVAKEEVEFEVRVDAAALEFAGIKSLFQSSVAGLKVDLINVVASRFNATLQVMVSLEDNVVVKEPTNAEFENILNPGEEVTEDLDLLTALNILGKAYTITWSSNNTDVISNTGVVNRPAMGSEDALVKLTAVLKLDGQTVATFEFEVTVLAKTEGELSKLETVTFEDFTTTTTYNNTTQLSFGPEGKQWGVVHGTPSTTGPINGSKSMQMRIYNNTNVSVYARTLYTVENVKEITFFALTDSAANVKVQVSVSTDGETWTNAQTYSLTTTGTEYKYTLAEASTVYVKFTLVVENKPSSGNWRLTIDDVTFWG